MATLKDVTELHSEWVAITIHTAKCDMCQKHNDEKIYRCESCSKQLCSACMTQLSENHEKSNHYNEDVHVYPGQKREAISGDASAHVIVNGTCKEAPSNKNRKTAKEDSSKSKASSSANKRKRDVGDPQDSVKGGKKHASKGFVLEDEDSNDEQQPKRLVCILKLPKKRDGERGTNLDQNPDTGTHSSIVHAASPREQNPTSNGPPHVRSDHEGLTLLIKAIEMEHPWFAMSGSEANTDRAVYSQLHIAEEPMVVRTADPRHPTGFVTSGSEANTDHAVSPKLLTAEESRVVRNAIAKHPTGQPPTEFVWNGRPFGKVRAGDKLQKFGNFWTMVPRDLNSGTSSQAGGNNVPRVDVQSAPVSRRPSASGSNVGFAQRSALVHRAVHGSSATLAPRGNDGTRVADHPSTNPWQRAAEGRHRYAHDEYGVRREYMTTNVHQGISSGIIPTAQYPSRIQSTGINSLPGVVGQHRAHQFQAVSGLPQSGPNVQRTAANSLGSGTGHNHTRIPAGRARYVNEAQSIRGGARYVSEAQSIRGGAFNLPGANRDWHHVLPDGFKGRTHPDNAAGRPMQDEYFHIHGCYRKVGRCQTTGQDIWGLAWAAEKPVTREEHQSWAENRELVYSASNTYLGPFFE